MHDDASLERSAKPLRNTLVTMAGGLCVWALTGCASAPLPPAPEPLPPEQPAPPEPPAPPTETSPGYGYYTRGYETPLWVDVVLSTGEIRPESDCKNTGIQAFPWPLPEPTDRAPLDPRAFGIEPGDKTSVDDVAEAVAKAIRGTGNVQIGYQSIGCDGFALISHLERVQPDGKPVEGSLRFLPPGANEPFSLIGYLKQLLTAPEGKYRQIVIVGTDKLLLVGSASPSIDTVMNWIPGGAATLPPGYDKMKWNDRHKLVALIYEFDRPAGNGKPVQANPGIGAALHLKGAGLIK